MKNIFMAITVLILVILYFLALLDIIKCEPCLTAEYAVIVFSVSAAIGFILSLRRGKKKIVV